MEIRGERECTDCGEQWSYYETGSIQCPACGSIRSVGVGERAEHTAGTDEFDLSAVRELVDEESLDTVAERASERAAEYVRTAGFVHAGALEPLDDTYLAAAELRRVGATLSRAMRITDEQELYFLELLRGADQEQRPAPAEVPASLHGERGLAAAAAAETYTRDLNRLHEEPPDVAVSVLSGLRARRKRIEALDGDVEPAEAETVVRALRDLATYLRSGDETALARAQDRLE